MFTRAADGTRSMDYTYRGEAYYMRYAPTDTPGCYAFGTCTVTDGRELNEGEYCR